MSIGNIIHLIRKEAILELRNKAILASMLIYVIGASFIVYFAFQGQIEFQVWAAIFWVIILFSATNIIGKTFDKEVRFQYNYLRTVVHPIELIISKLLYNAILIFVFELVVFLEMLLFFGVDIDNMPLFFLTLFLGGIGFSNLFTLFSTITSRTGNVVLLSVLGFPIILPLLLLILRLTGISEVDVLSTDTNVNIGAVVVLDLITAALSLVLFPYLWNE
ncbi:MAG: heme exporter protein CcmB [Chitinophagales bacterium]|nr:heme exporter protein CcmB [Chitinophagales bacterium]MCZ2394095.1 heme exporter protein CcmB [Chitinophagales bacterium]